MVPETAIIRDKTQLSKWVKDRFGLVADIEPFRDDGIELGCLGRRWGSSSGPIIWTQNRLMESGQWHEPGYPFEIEDTLPFVMIAGKAHLCPAANYARSKIFNTELLPKPIDMTAVRVMCLVYDSFQ